MISTWNRYPAPAGLALGLAATLLLGVAGCGGKGTESGDAVVVTAPDATVPTVGSGSTAGAPAGGSSTAATAPAPAGANANANANANASATSPAAKGTVKAEGWGTLKGKVTLKGPPPPPKPLREKGKAEKNPEVCAKDAPILSERLIVDEGSKGVKNVLVYLTKPSAVNDEARSNAQSAQIVFDQDKCIFIPHVLGVMTGAKVELKNTDPFSHNINSQLKNNGFNKVLAGSQDSPQSITEPEKTPGRLVCDIHPWMSAYWMVLDHPYFAVTDAQGNFEIKNVPAGTQKIVVWQEAVAPKGYITAPSGDSVEVKPGDTTSKDFAIDAGKLLPE